MFYSDYFELIKTNRFDGELQRHSDYYIFSLLHHIDQKTINPLDLYQWTFYILNARTLDKERPNKKTITLSSLLKLKPIECKYGQINELINAKKKLDVIWNKTKMRTYPDNLINRMNGETKALFEKLFEKEKNSKIEIVNELNKVTKPIGGFLQRKLTYKELLELTAKKQNINTSNLSANEIEESIMIKRFNENFETLSDEEKQKFHTELTKEFEKQGLDSSQIKSLTTIGALTAASASGFSMYIMASTIVGGISGILGITLPFAFYTGMSSVLSVVTGPIGWTVGLGYLVYKFKDESLESASEKFTTGWKFVKNFISGDFERASTIVSIICSVRILNNKKVNQKIKNVIEKISTIEIDKMTLMNEIKIKDSQIKEKENQIKQLHSDLNDELEAKQKIENNLKIANENINDLNSEKFKFEQEII